MEGFKPLGMDMGQFTVVMGAMLMVLGGVFYMVTGMQNITALIPSFIGFPFMVIGVLAIARPATRKVGLHIAVLLGVVCVAGGVGEIPNMFQTGFMEDGEIKFAMIEKLLMMQVGMIYTVQCVRSFIAARRVAD